jgi:hypothetical protein
LHYSFSLNGFNACRIYNRADLSRKDLIQLNGTAKYRKVVSILFKLFGTRILYIDSCEQAAGSFTSEANISGDPKFVNSASGDFHLASGSPCLKAGVDWRDYNANQDATERINMGCYISGSEIIGIDTSKGGPVASRLFPHHSERKVVRAGSQNLFGVNNTFIFSLTGKRIRGLEQRSLSGSFQRASGIYVDRNKNGNSGIFVSANLR